MENPLQDFSYSTECHSEIVPPPMSLVINMTMLDEIERKANDLKEIVLNVDGKMHRYKTEDVLKILREIELD